MMLFCVRDCSGKPTALIGEDLERKARRRLLHISTGSMFGLTGAGTPNTSHFDRLNAQVDKMLLKKMVYLFF